MIPLPQTCTWQRLDQPSPFTRFESSHCSPDSWMPFPQTFGRQTSEHPSPFVVLPSSHCSGASTTPLPHAAGVQSAVQESPFVKFPSSHCSDGSSITPSPQYVPVETRDIGTKYPPGTLTRIESHETMVPVAPSARLVSAVPLRAPLTGWIALAGPLAGPKVPSMFPAPSSRRFHTSPKPAIVQRPVTSHPRNTQSGEHVSDGAVLPSSHCSPGSRTPLPQMFLRQPVEQPSPLMRLPSSHSSPDSTIEFPHTFGRQTDEQP